MLLKTLRFFLYFVLFCTHLVAETTLYRPLPLKGSKVVQTVDITQKIQSKKDKKQKNFCSKISLSTQLTVPQVQENSVVLDLNLICFKMTLQNQKRSISYDSQSQENTNAHLAEIRALCRENLRFYLDKDFRVDREKTPFKKIKTNYPLATQILSEDFLVFIIEHIFIMHNKEIRKGDSYPVTLPQFFPKNTKDITFSLTTQRDNEKVLCCQVSQEVDNKNIQTSQMGSYTWDKNNPLLFQAKLRSKMQKKNPDCMADIVLRVNSRS